MKISNRKIGVMQPSWQGWAKIAGIVGVLFLSLSLNCSRPASNDPLTITFLDPEWSHDLTGLNVLPDERLQEFARQTGIRVKHLPLPETALDQLDVTRDLLRKGPSSPDVVGVDTIWPGTLSDDLMDLKPDFAPEVSSMNPDVVASYTVNGKLLAVPYRADMGVLFYRKDLLRAYGYTTTPKTWDELETMAARIQQGERAKGKKDFWGFLWPGAAGEGLTCNAMEWQMSEGGGRVIEEDKTISVNNPGTILALRRARHWIGFISPPSVVSGEEWDTVNAFYHGGAAFYRGWALTYFLSVEGNPGIRDTIGITNIPGGRSGRAATLGGFGLGVSRTTAHPAEALKLVQFLVRKEQRFEALRWNSDPANSDSAVVRDYEQRGSVLSRPSAVTGQRYEDVDHSYIGAFRLDGQSQRTGSCCVAGKGARCDHRVQDGTS